MWGVGGWQANAGNTHTHANNFCINIEIWGAGGVARRGRWDVRGWGGGGWDGGLVGKVGVRGVGDGQIVGWWDGGNGGWGVGGGGWGLGIGFVDFWSEGQKIIQCSRS